MKKLRFAVFFIFPAVFSCALASANDDLDRFLKIPGDAVHETDKFLEENIFNLGEIRVSSNRLSSSLDQAATDTPGNVTVIGTRELKEDGQPLVPEVLSRLEGVTYTDNLGQGVGATVDLRGFGGEGKQALVLFDGMRAVEPFDNSVTWSLYPSEYLKEIDVRRGGESTVYGEGALSGVIELKTKEPTKEFHMTAEEDYGDFATQKSFVETSGTVADTGFYIGSRYFSTDGYRQNADHESTSVLTKANRQISEFIRAENSFYYAYNKTGIPGPLSYEEMQQDRRQKDPDGQFGDHFTDELTQDQFELTYFAEPINAEFSNMLGWRYRQQDSQQTFGGSFPGTSINLIRTETFSDVIQGTWGWENDWVKSDVSGGVEWSIDDIHNPSTFVDSFGDAFDSEHSVDRSMIGTFWQERLTFLKKLIVEGGLRFDSIHWNLYDLLSPELENHKKADHVSPKIGLEYKIFDPLSVYGSYSEAFKAPDVNTLIFETPNIFTPNPNIDPSVAHHYETGVRYAHPVWGSVRADVFYIETKKEILFDDITKTNENFDTKREGFEIADEIAFRKDLEIFANYTYTDAEFDNGVFDGKQVPLVPMSRWTAGAVAGPFHGFTVSVSATGVYGQFALNDFNNLFPVNDYWTLNGKISYHYKNWEMYFRAENLLNEEYSSFVTSDGVSTLDYNPAPKLYVEGGVRIRI